MKNLRDSTKVIKFVLTDKKAYSGSLNEVRTRVLALRGLRPRPLVDKATKNIWNNITKNFFCKRERIFWLML